MSKLTRHDISTEEYREYEWTDPVTGDRTLYRIDYPVDVYLYKGATTHRIVDSSGVAHLCPSVGLYGCVVRWKSHPGLPAVHW